MHTPDNWVILEVNPPNENTYYKVLAGWSGGYLDGDSWRLNSGIEKVEETEDYYDFIGASGSVYRCGKNSETIRMNCAGVYSQLKEQYGDVINQIDYKDFIEKF